MRLLLRPCARPRLLTLAALAALTTAGIHAAATNPVAVVTNVYNGYTRTRLDHHAFQPETYTFGEGGCWSRAGHDPALEHLSFKDVARAIAGPLARLQYQPSAAADDTQLLIVVFWGTTQGSSDHEPMGAASQFAGASAAYSAAATQLSDAKQNDPMGDHSSLALIKGVAATDLASAQVDLALANRARDRLDAENALLLGYRDVFQRANDVPWLAESRDVFSELGDNRYFVVLHAFDFATARKEKKLKLLWTARLSMAEAGTDFTEALEAMLKDGARYFGQDSHGLHRWIVPEGRVDLGPTQVLETTEVK